MKAVGTHYNAEGACEFAVWAPFLKDLSLSIVFPLTKELELPLPGDGHGYFHALVHEVPPGTKYFYRIQGQLYPDPASHSQPEGVWGPSCTIDHTVFPWQDSRWKGIPLKEMIIYELHIGTFTVEGTFEAAAARLADLVELGITAVEIMPVAQCSGERNWGYDGVFPFAVQHSYGGPQGLKMFVDSCHAQGLAVILDVVYNHLGPEGNIVEKYMPVFTDRYHTPWGRAINFDDAYSDDVKHFFIQNALHWFQHFHIDALRLDAIQTIYDMGAKHFLRELAEIVDEFSGRIGRKFYLIAESDLNDRRIVLERQREGFGIDSQWSDDFHHAVHARLTGETQGYYQDFGSTEKIARALKNGFVLDGRFSDFRKRTHGSFSQDMPSQRFVVCVQNHDQVGNRFKSDRLSSLLSFEALKLAAAVLITAPYVPLVFMGEEYAEEAPFNYFVDFKDEGLIRAVREGRRREFAAFGWKNEPLDPFAADTFLHSKLHWDKRREGRHAVLLSFYKRLFELRKTVPALKALDREGMTVAILEDVIMVKRLWADSCILILMNFGKARADINSGEDFQMGDRILDSCEAQWLGKGTSLPQRLLPSTVLTLNPLSFALYQEI